MYYSHKYFNLDIKARKVFDENQKELRLTGNAYRVLVFLCKNGASTITEIGDGLDREKDYDENNIRQYRYKINTIIGHNIVKYNNKIYSIDGEVKKVEEIKENNSVKLDKNNRNTVLLRDDSVELKNNNKTVDNSKKIKFSKAPAIIAIIALLLTFIDWHSYGYYTFMKFIVTGVTIYYAYYIYAEVKKIDLWFWILTGIAILFNPIIPIYLRDKTLWGFIDVLVIGVLVFLIINFKKYNK